MLKMLKKRITNDIFLELGIGALILLSLILFLFQNGPEPMFHFPKGPPKSVFFWLVSIVSFTIYFRLKTVKGK